VFYLISLYTCERHSLISYYYTVSLALCLCPVRISRAGPAGLQTQTSLEPQRAKRSLSRDWSHQTVVLSSAERCSSLGPCWR